MMENIEQTIQVKDVKILETVEDIQERRDQVQKCHPIIDAQ
jgi:hypothetical protein